MRTIALAVALVVGGLMRSAAFAEMTTLPSGPQEQQPATAPASPDVALPATAPSSPEVGSPEPGAEADPLEGMNRRIFWFNDRLDVYILEPTAKGWDFVMPQRAEICIRNFFWNLLFPIVTVNNLLQWKPMYAAESVGRFAVNTTVGVAGLFDPATGWGLEPHWEDFGQTLGWWGLGSGAYLVLPILGPTSVRDGAGMIVDYPLTVTPFFIEWYYLTGARVIETVNTRALYLETIKNAKESSFDYYTFVRNAYLQRRTGLVNDRAETETDTTSTSAPAPAPAESDDSLYHPE